MNEAHRELCASEEWRDALRDFVLPFALAEARVGDDVLEVGPGPGLTTDLLRTRLKRLTALELDPALAAALTARMADSNVTVVEGDATAMPFDDERFTGVVSFTMLHHVPTAEMQDHLFAEVARVLRPGGVFVASDSMASADLAAFHVDDVYNPIDPTTVEARLRAAGFGSIAVRSNEFGWAALAGRS
jgi:SAM-dependent methyltransferase